LKVTVFTDARESTPLIDVKKIIEGITKVPPKIRGCLEMNSP